MANLNDYKIISQKSLKYFELLSKELGITKLSKEKDCERLWFYLFILEYITNKNDFNDLIMMITDEDFNNLVFKKGFNDFWVDCVNINEDENLIELFNFKYRESFKDQKQHVSEIILSTKFINSIITWNTDELEDKLKDYAIDIIDKLNGKEIWKLKLYIVSNENFEIEYNIDLKRLEELYGMEIIQIWLNEISEYITLRPKFVNADLILDKDAIMTFSESNLSSSKSYIIRLPLSEVIRITCTDENLRNEYNIEDITRLSNVNLDFSVLFDNVRWFVTKSKFNNNILKTLEEEPNRFFIYNNWLTLTVKDLDVDDRANLNKRAKFHLGWLQVLNWWQTLRTIHYFNKKDPKNILENLSNAQISLRIFKVSSNLELNNKIAEFTNSQNAISNIDLKSLRSEQLQLEQYLWENGILYTRKSWDTWDERKDYNYKISMERFWQILFSLAGNPEKATNQKKSIFEKNYDSIFWSWNLIIEDSPKYIKRYFEIQKKYSDLWFSITEQKIFYILYLDQNIKKDIKDLIYIFEECIEEYNKEEKDLWYARKLIQKDFKTLVDKKFNII